jgi:hypothetical protein
MRSQLVLPKLKQCTTLWRVDFAILEDRTQANLDLQAIEWRALMTSTMHLGPSGLPATCGGHAWSLTRTYRLLMWCYRLAYEP